jgi:hypothetical protein
MARLSIKATYSLDPRTVRALERMAKRWKVTKSEALRRAILLAERAGEGDSPDALHALDELQNSLGMTTSRLRDWSRAAREERRASSSRRESGGS